MNSFCPSLLFLASVLGFSLPSLEPPNYPFYPGAIMTCWWTLFRRWSIASKFSKKILNFQKNSKFSKKNNFQKVKIFQMRFLKNNKKSERHSMRHIFGISIIQQFPCRVDPYQFNKIKNYIICESQIYLIVHPLLFCS